jgi:hypothetical protein
VPLPQFESVQLELPPEPPHLIYRRSPRPILVGGNDDDGNNSQYICKCKHPRRGYQQYKSYIDYNDDDDAWTRCKLRQREHIFDGGMYFYVSTANDFLSSLAGSSETKPVGISEWELDMVNNFLIQFPYGFGGPLQQRRTKISAKECLYHYMELSLDQFKKGDFLLVCWKLVERIFGRFVSKENEVFIEL